MRARQAVNMQAAFKVGAGLGAFLFLFAGGTPWTSGGTMNAVLGRPMPWPWYAIFAVHFALCIVYMVVLANVVYRFKLIAAIGAGIFTSLVLYAFYWVVFAMTMGYNHDIANGRALVAHVMFGLLGTAIYKAVSVPRPLPDDRDLMEEEMAHSPRR
jgi:hypothetical protein